MKLNVTIGCSACSFQRRNTVKLPFDCDSLPCPGCGSENCLSIVAVHDKSSMFSPHDIQKRLQRMREIHAS